MAELKSGDTYNGKLEIIDKFMNIRLSEVILTSKVALACSLTTYSRQDRSKFFRMKEAFIKGSAIRSIQLHEAIVDKTIEELQICISDCLLH